jgi:putative ABC transport system permease protein
MFRQNIKIVLRNMLRQKGYTFINIAGLAVGMAFAIMIMIWVQYEYSFEKFHDNLDQLFLVAFTTDDNEFHGDATAGALAAYLESEYPEITHATRVSFSEWWQFGYEGKKFVGHGRFIDPTFFEMFSFSFIQGEQKTTFVDPHSIVITESLAKRIFGDEDPIGKILDVRHMGGLSVTGLLKDVPANTELEFEFLVPCEIGSDVYNKWDIKSLKTYAMLRKDSDFREVSLKIRDAYNIHNPHDINNNQYLVPLRDTHLYDLSGGGRYIYTIIFSLMAAAILLIACMNFMNLSTARSEKRIKEIGVKKVFGASRKQLIFQTLGESLVLSLIALFLALIVAELTLPVINSIIRTSFGIDYSGTVIFGILGIALMTGIASGSYPAFFLSSFRPVAVLGRHTPTMRISRGWFGKILGGSSRGSSFRRFLVIAQFAVSIMLIIVVIVIYRQLHYVKNMDMGFDKDQIALFYMPGELVPKTATVKNELKKHSNIQSVTVSSNSLTRWQTSFGISWEGKQPDQIFDVGFNKVDYDFVETFGLQMVEGRFFSQQYPSDASEAYVVNEAAVKAMRVSDPVGRKITIAPGSSWEKQGVIIGVVKDFNTESAHKEIRPFMIGLTETGGIMCVRIGSEDIVGTVRFMKSKVSEIVPNASIRCLFFNQILGNLYQMEFLTGTVVIYITILAIFISSLGLFGLAAYTAEQRTKEIGIRKVLGASIASVMRLLSKEYLVLVMIANIIAWPVAYYSMSRWLQNFAFRIDLDWITFALAGFLALVIALLTVSSQAARAASANPVISLRHE